MNSSNKNQKITSGIDKLSIVVLSKINSGWWRAHYWRFDMSMSIVNVYNLRVVLRVLRSL